MKKIALVTGASSGIGHASALRMHEAGFVVYAAARSTEEMKDLQALGIKTVAMDVTREESMVQGVKHILTESGHIDVLANIAGYGSYGAVEDVPLAEARNQFEVNLFGGARLIQLVLPGMREQCSGTIINITSMGGKIHTPFGAWYHATKFAFEALSDCLRLETKPYGINVVIIEPGAIRTKWGGIAADHLRETSGHGAYAEQANAVAKAFSSDSTAKQSSDPDVIAKTVVKAATAHKPKTRYAKGYGAKLLIFVREFLPDRAYDAFILRMTSSR